MMSSAGPDDPGRHEFATEFVLQARRYEGGFAGSARLDAGLTLRLNVGATLVRVSFQMSRNGVPVATLRRVVSRQGSLPPGLHTLWLSDLKRFFSLNGMEPIGAYSLTAEEVHVETAGGEANYAQAGGVMTQLEPAALGEEIFLPPHASHWHYFNAAPALKPAAGEQQANSLRLSWQGDEQGSWPMFGCWSYNDPADPALAHDSNLLYRFRYKLTTSLASWNDVRGVRLRTGLDLGRDVNALQLEGKLVNGSLATPPNAPHSREYTLFLAHRNSPAPGPRHLIPNFEVVSNSDEGTSAPGTVELTELAVSRVPIADVQWMKTIEWNFSTSPYAAGWKKDVEPGDLPFVIPSYETRWTEWDEVNNSHRHGLLIETKAPHGHNGGWKFENLFQFRTWDSQGNINAGKGYDLRSRVMKVTATVRGNLPGNKLPIIQFLFEGNGFSNQYQVAGLFLQDGSPAPANHETELTFFFAPSHNQLLADLSAEAPKPLTFRFRVLNSFLESDPAAQVVLEHLKIHEALIGDMPEGLGYAQYQDDWPQISVPGPIGAYKTVHPSAPDCPVTAKPADNVFLVNDHGWALSNGRWHLYGIFESGIAIKPMPAGPREDKTQYNTIGATSFFVSGIAHVRGCAANSGLNKSTGASEYLDDVRPQPPDEPNKEIMVPSGPGEMWNLWAPTIIEYGGAFWMFYSSSWGFDIWLAKSNDPELNVASWQSANRDGSIGGTRLPVVPSSAPMNGRDFTVVRSLDLNDEVVFHGYWNGGDPARVYHVEALSPLAFDYTTAKTVYTMINSDSGRMPQDSESVYVIYDENAQLFYLTISKDGNLAPGFGVGTTFLLDYTKKAIIAADPVAGDRSIIIDNSNKRDPSEPDLIAPVDMVSAEIVGGMGNAASILEGGIVVRANAMVLDRADGVPGAAAMILCNLRNGRRTLFSGRGRGSGTPLELPGRLLMAQYIEPNMDEVNVVYFMTDRCDWAGTNGRLCMIDGGTQKKLRSNFVGQFGATLQQATGDRTELLANLGDPIGLIFDTQNIYVACRNQGTILRANAQVTPTGPLTAQVFQSGLTNPTELADAVERLYVLESAAGWRIRWFMKDGSASGSVPEDPTLPFAVPTCLKWLYDFRGEGPHLLLGDTGDGGRVIALRLADGRRSVVSSSLVGEGPIALPLQVVQGMIWDEVDDSVVKVYWSSDPNSFDQFHYIVSMNHHAAEWVCDTTEAGDPWYFTFTNFARVNSPDGEERIASYGWGVQPVEWAPPIARPVE